MLMNYGSVEVFSNWHIEDCIESKHIEKKTTNRHGRIKHWYFNDDGGKMPLPQRELVNTCKSVNSRIDVCVSFNSCAEKPNVNIRLCFD